MPWLKIDNNVILDLSELVHAHLSIFVLFLFCKTICLFLYDFYLCYSWAVASLSKPQLKTCMNVEQNITQLMSCVHGPVSRFESKDSICQGS